VFLLFLSFLLSAGQARNGAAGRCGDFVEMIRAELPASVEKSGVFGSITNVVVAGQSLAAAAAAEAAGYCAAPAVRSGAPATLPRVCSQPA
jgi:hypothetical protein